MERKKLIGIFIVAPLLIALTVVGLTRKCRRSGNHPKLEIVRESPDLAAQNHGSEVVLENGMIKGVFSVSPTTFQIRDESESAKDPFAEPVQPTQTRSNTKTPKKVLENVGVTFGKGASATYNPMTNELTAVNTREQLDLIDAFLGATICFAEMQIAVRAEIYEMPALTALEAIESAAAQGNHTPERNAIRKLLGQGRVKLVNATTVIARSGQRAKIEDAQDFPLPLSKTSATKKEDENGDKPDWKIHKIGTLFEVDPVLGADNFTIDLNFSLEHHTALPNPKSTGKAIPPILHAKKITTQFILLDGFTILVGSWKPTGKPEYEKADLTHLVFITANVQMP